MKIESLFGLGVLRVCIGRIDEGQQMLLDANKCRPYCESYNIALAICSSAKGKLTNSNTPDLYTHMKLPTSYSVYSSEDAV